MRQRLDSNQWPVLALIAGAALIVVAAAWRREYALAGLGLVVASGALALARREARAARRHRAVVDAQELAGVGSWHLNVADYSLTWSAVTYRIFEIPEDVTGADLFQRYRDRIHPEDRVEMDRLLAHAPALEDTFIFNHRLILDGGRIRHVRAVTRLNRAADGSVPTMTGVCQDLTDLMQLQEQNRFILRVMGIGIWIYNPVTQDLIWDSSLYDLYGLKAEDFSGHYDAWQSSLSDEARAQAVGDLGRALSGERDLETTFEIVTRAGQRKNLGARGFVIRDDAGRPLMMYGINWDRTAEVKLETSLQFERARSVHSSKLASLGEMSAGIAHEINNPLAIITGAAALLARSVGDESKLLARVETINKSAARIEKIVRGLRKFARTSEGTVHQVESLAELVAEALILTEAKSKRHSTPVTAHVPADLRISCDAVEIEQVLVNLINNGIDAVKAGADRWIRIDAFAEGDQVILRVTDAGPGIPAEVETRLFQPFFTTKPVGEGTGLGLSITKGILDTHRAHFALNRAMPNTCFEIRFQAATAGRTAA